MGKQKNCFNYRRASLILAEAQFISVGNVCQKYNLPRGTYDTWLARLKRDDKLKEMYDRCVEEYANGWKAEALSLMKKVMEVSSIGLDNHPFDDKPKKVAEKEAWGKNMNAMSNLVKSVGDLNVSTHVLMEEDEEED